MIFSVNFEGAMAIYSRYVEKINGQQETLRGKWIGFPQPCSLIQLANNKDTGYPSLRLPPRPFSTGYSSLFGQSINGKGPKCGLISSVPARTSAVRRQTKLWGNSRKLWGSCMKQTVHPSLQMSLDQSSPMISAVQSLTTINLGSRQIVRDLQIIGRHFH